MNTLTQQALVAQQSGWWNEWYAGLTDEQREQLKTDTEIVTKSIVDAFAPVGESFARLGQNIVNSLASVIEVESA